MMNIIIAIVLLALALITAVHLYRQHWCYKDLEPLFHGEIDADFYEIGETVVAVKRGQASATTTVICFPGFLENMRYFQALYADSSSRLILVNNADYHCPYAVNDIEPLPGDANPYEIGTIEHDGFQLALVIRSLAPRGGLVLHGHSRGGAVVLEAGRQFPELMQDESRPVKAVLEAPVLPQAKMAGSGSKPLPHRIITYLLPIVLGLGRKSPVEKLLQQPMMQPTNELKTELCQGIFSNARHYATCVTNARSIQQWQMKRSFDLFTHYRQVEVIIGARDDVLDNATMNASAEQGRQLNAGVKIVQTSKTNHFISLEQPSYLRKAAGL